MGATRAIVAIMDLDQALALAAEQLGTDRIRDAVVFGSAPMALAGLPRAPRDLDLFLSPRLYAELREGGVEERRDEHGHPFLQLAPGIEAWASFPGVTWEQVHARARLDPRAHGLRVADLGHVRTYKSALVRPSDQADIQLIDALLGSSQR